MDRIVDECRKCDGQLICRASITPGHTACELFRKKRAQNTMVISETDNQHTQPAIQLPEVGAFILSASELGIKPHLASSLYMAIVQQASA